MTDHAQEQEMEIEALEAILMDEFQEIDSGESGLKTSNRCFQILISPQDDTFDESIQFPVQLALIFAHTEKYPDEPPLLNVRSVKGIRPDDLTLLKEKLDNEAKENLGMSMVYTLATSAKEWLTEKFSGEEEEEEPEEKKIEDEVIIPHGEAVTVESFIAWRERFEAELALERAKLMPESALTAAAKEKKLTGRQWYESGRQTSKGAVEADEGSEEEDEDIDFDEDFEDDDDEDDMLEHYLAERSDK